MVTYYFVLTQSLEGSVPGHETVMMAVIDQPEKGASIEVDDTLATDCAPRHRDPGSAQRVEINDLATTQGFGAVLEPVPPVGHVASGAPLR